MDNLEMPGNLTAVRDFTKSEGDVGEVSEKICQGKVS